MIAESFTIENGIKEGEKNLLLHQKRCPKRPKFTKSHYIENNLLFVLWTENNKNFRYIPFMEINNKTEYQKLIDVQKELYGDKS